MDSGQMKVVPEAMNENPQSGDRVKQARKTFSTLGWCYVAGTVLINVLQIAAAYFLRDLKPEWQQDTVISLVISGVIVYGCGLPLIYWLVQRVPVTPIEKKRIKWWQFPVWFVMCYAMVYLSNLVGTLITVGIGSVKGRPVDNHLLEYVTGGNMLANFILMVVVAPIVEEFIFRKLIVDRTVRYGQGVAIAVSGLMFGLFHGNLNQFAYAVVLGAFFALIYIKTGDIRITIGMHACVNFIGSIVSMALFKMVDYQKLMELAESGDTDALMGHVMNNLPGWILFGIFGLFILGMVIGGIVLMIVFRKIFYLEPVEEALPAGRKFSTVFLNSGMIVFGIVWVATIILQLLA